MAQMLQSATFSFHALCFAFSFMPHARRRGGMAQKVTTEM